MACFLDLFFIKALLESTEPSQDPPLTQTVQGPLLACQDYNWLF